MVTQNILDLLEYCIFDGELTEENFQEKILDNLPENFQYDWFYGASKCVLIPKGADYVIKIPFNGMESYEELYDEDNDEYYGGEWYFENYTGCQHGEGWDYCLAEAILYHKAKQAKILDVFCKTKLIGRVNNHPIYTQSRAIPFSWYYLKKEKDYESERSKKIQNYCKKKELPQLNSIWLADAFEYYGERRFNKIMNFIKKERLNDFHTDNIGYIGHQPILIDFSGFLS